MKIGSILGICARSGEYLENDNYLCIVTRSCPRQVQFLLCMTTKENILHSSRKIRNDKGIQTDGAETQVFHKYSSKHCRSISEMSFVI